MEEISKVITKITENNACIAQKTEDQTSETIEEPQFQASNGGNAAKQSEAKSRLNLFNNVMEKSLEKFIDGASFHRFANTFHPFYKKNPQVMESIHKQFIADLQKTIKEDINRLILEGQLQCKMDELDSLEKAANSTEPTWRPSGAPEQDLCSFVMPYYQKQELYLRQELKKIKKENAALVQRVQAGREGISQTEQRIATAVDEWKVSVREYQSLSSLCPVDLFDE